MKRTINFIGNILGTFSALLFFAEIFYHTTNDYFFICTKFRDLSLYGWGMMLLLWSGALFLWQKKKVSLLPFVAWMSVICIVLEFYRFLIYSDNENCRFYIRIVLGMEIATLLLAIYKRCSVAAVYSIAAFIITVFGHFAVVPSLCYLSNKILFIFLSLGTVLWMAIKLCHSYQWHKCKRLLKSFSWLIVGGILLSVAVMWYQHMVFGIHFYEKPITEAVENPKVSVIMPVYNGEKTVRRTLDSLLKQTLKEMEIIAVDDGSTDSTPKILDDYAEKYKNITVIHQKNAYVGAARNAGRKKAQGIYIAFIDADDTVSEDFYEKMYQTAIKNHADIVAAEKVLFVWENKDNQTEPYHERAAFTQNDEIEDLASYRQKVDGYVWDKLYRKSFLDKHNIWCTLRRTPAEDNFLTTPALMFADKMYVAKGAKFYYHRGSPSETGVKHTKLSDEIVEMFTDLDDSIKSSGLDEAKIVTWLKATTIARQRIVGNYYDCLPDEDKAVAKEKILKVFPEDMVIFENPSYRDEPHHQLYQQI